MNKILVVDDDQDFCFNLSTILQENGFAVVTAASGREALLKIQAARPDLVLLDLRLPDIEGMKVLQKIKESHPDLDIIIITAYIDVKDAIRAMKLGAYDYITKPFDNEELLLTINKTLEVQHLRGEISSLKKELGEKPRVEKVMGDSSQIKKVLIKVDLVAPTDFTH